MKTKSNLGSDVNSLVLAKSRAYIKPTPKKTLEIEDSDEEERKQLRKATEADKERKREKMRLKRQKKREARAKSKKKDISEAKNLSINYLHMWNSARDMWSFKKKQQYWLISNVFDVENVSNENFKIFVDYIVDLKGEAKKKLTANSEDIIKKHEKKFEDGTISEEDSVIFERARSILQILV